MSVCEWSANSWLTETVLDRKLVLKLIGRGPEVGCGKESGNAENAHYMASELGFFYIPVTSRAECIYRARIILSAGSGGRSTN